LASAESILPVRAAAEPCHPASGQKTRLIVSRDVGSGAGPLPGGRRCRHRRPHRIEIDVEQRSVGGRDRGTVTLTVTVFGPALA
jgi:hypothetical protein